MTPQTEVRPAVVEKRPQESFFSTALHQPRKLLLRRALFQVHLWAGVLLACYASLIGVTGMIAVFQMDLAMKVPHRLQAMPRDPARYQPLDTIQASARAALPKARFVSFLAPDESRHAFGSLARQGEELFLVVIDPYDAKVLRVVSFKHHWALLAGELHENLFLGRSGAVINGVAALGMILLLVSGLALWWRGLARWKSGLYFRLKSGWKAVNYNLHYAVGFWAALFLAMWSITAILMVWPETSTSAINRISPITEAVKEPSIKSPAPAGACTATMQQIVEAAQKTEPSTRFAAYVTLPRPAEPARLYMARGMLQDRSQWSELFFDPCTGRLLSNWQRWVWKSPGDMVVVLSRPLHAGFIWGRWAQWVWFCFGLSLPVLGISGLLMYWNRYLSKQWKKLRLKSFSASS